jgi:hypothetical protein
MKLSKPDLPPRREWQDRELTEHLEPKRNIFASPRTGKTMYAAEWLRGIAKDHGIERGLVSAPLRVCPLWVATLEDAGLPVIPAFKSGAAATRGMRDWSGIVVTNVDKLHPLRPEFSRAEAVVLDEVHDVAGPSSQRGRAGRAIARRARFYRGLTGTPVANHHGSLWAPLHMADAFPGPWGAFMNRYTERHPYFPSQVTKHIRAEELMKLMLSCSSIVRREDVFGPDTYEPIYRSVAMPPAAMAMYRKLAKEWVASGEGWLVDGTHPLARQTRLQQLTSGIAVDSEGIEHPMHSAKIEAAMGDLGEIIESGEKAVVFHRFRPEGHQMVAALERAGIPSYEINGDFDAAASEAQRAAWAATEGGAVIVVQIMSGGVGISLAEATHALYLSRTYSFIKDEQSRDRIYSPGAVRTVTYYTCPGTIDTFIARALAQKRDVHDAVRSAGRAEIVFGEAA